MGLPHSFYEISKEAYMKFPNSLYEANRQRSLNEMAKAAAYMKSPKKLIYMKFPDGR